MKSKSLLVSQGTLGCLVYPYKKRQSQIEHHTGTYDRVYHKYIEYVGFNLPYRGINAYLTYSRDPGQIKYMLPLYTLETKEINPYRSMTKLIHLRNLESFRSTQSSILDQIDSTKSNHNVWFINLQTGQGKTVLATYLSTLFNLKTLVLCFSDDILSQWVECYYKYTDIDHSKILKVTGKKLEMILSGALDPNLYDIFIATPTLLDRFCSTRGNYGLMEDIFEKCGIGTMIYDEAHRNVSNIVKINALVDVRYQLYLSADYGQGDPLKESMYYKLFRNATILTPPEDMVRSLNYTDLVVYSFNTNPSEMESFQPFNRYGFSAELYMKYEFEKGVLIDGIRDLIRTIRKNSENLENKILILFTNIIHVDHVYEVLKTEFENETVGRHHGKVTVSEKEYAKNDASIIVATYNSFSTGIDTDRIKYVISTNQCNKVQDNQAAGRARPMSDGSNSMYIIMIDEGFEYCKKKLNTRLNYLLTTKSKDRVVYKISYKGETHYE